MVPADSRRIPRAPRYSGAAWSRGLHFAYGTVTLFRQAFLPVPLCIAFRTVGGPTTPGDARDVPGLGSCAFARHYLRNRFYFLFLRVLRCFSSPGSPQVLAWCRDRSRRVSPFGHPRVTGHLPLTAAFRSLSRPSSPPRTTGIPRAPLFTFFIFLRPHPSFSLAASGGMTFAYIRLARYLDDFSVEIASLSLSRFAFPPCQ